LATKVQRLNSRGVKVAREARETASREILIAGSMALASRSGAPSRADQIRAIFHEQAMALEERASTFLFSKRFLT